MAWQIVLLKILGTQAASKAIEKTIDTLHKSLSQQPVPPNPSVAEDSRARLDILEREVRRQADVVTKVGTTLEEFGNGLRPLVLKVTLTFWSSLAALALSLVALYLSIVRH